MPSLIDAAPGLRRAGAAGSFFKVDVSPEGIEWQSVSTLLDPYSGALAIGVGSTRATLGARGGGDVDARVAASLWFFGWSARLVSPWLGAAVLGDVVPWVAPEALLWRAGPAQPVPLGVVRPMGRPVGAGELADRARADRAGPAGTVERAAALYTACVGTLVEPLLESTASSYPVSRQVLWGNVASAVAGAAGQLARAVPAAAAAAAVVARELLGVGRLAGQGGWTQGQFARRTCCLMYRLADTGLCADCVLVRRPSEDRPGRPA